MANIFTAFDSLAQLQRFISETDSLKEIRCHPRQEQFCRLVLLGYDSKGKALNRNKTLRIDPTAGEYEIEFIFDDHSEVVSIKGN
jgi:hypothetical protein